MPQLTVDRLRLRLQGVSQGDARELVRLIAQGLAGADVDAAGGTPALDVRVAPLPGTSMQNLSEQIVADLVGQLNRTL